MNNNTTSVHNDHHIHDHEELAGDNSLYATVVSDEERLDFWPQHFGSIPQWITLEPRIFSWMDRLCADYCGGIWHYHTLSNGGAFMVPEADDYSDDKWTLTVTAQNSAARLQG
jgi:hypothetical protein